VTAASWADVSPRSAGTKSIAACCSVSMHPIRADRRCCHYSTAKVFYGGTSSTQNEVKRRGPASMSAKHRSSTTSTTRYQIHAPVAVNARARFR
jgi:hypothetical protein